jgi:hypothetical protein
MYHTTTPCRLNSLPFLMPLYSTLKSRAASALIQLRNPEAEWRPCSVASALGMSLAQLAMLERWALLPRGLRRQETLMWLEGLASLYK